MTMNTHDLELSTRLDRLERENRRFKRFGLAAALAVGALGLAAAAPVMCDVVMGERLVLRDTSGRQRVLIDAYRVDNPSLSLADAQGRVRAKLALDAQGDLVVNLLDEKGATKGTHRFGADQPATRSDIPEGKRDTTTMLR
jgi:hypothetical protein